VVNPGRDHFGDGGKPQIGADGGQGGDAEQQKQQWRHQRAATDAGEAHQQAGKRP